MPINPSAITDRILNGNGTKESFWEKTRYLVAMSPVTPDFTETTTELYMGCTVIPGPLANPDVLVPLAEQDIQILEQEHFITFWDNEHTDGADEKVWRGKYGIMTTEEADAFEAAVLKIKGVSRDKDPLLD